MTETAHLALIPRDGLFCKDGRGWFTSASNRGHALDWPWPQTILGALRTAWGRTEEARRGRAFRPDEWADQTAAIALGPTFPLRRPHGAAWEPGQRMWPAPADARWLKDEKEVARLDPVPSDVPTLGRDDDDAREALWRPQLDDRQKPEPPPAWLPDADFIAWLAGRPVPVRRERFRLAKRVQIHVTVDPSTLTAKEGLLYSHDVVETVERDAEWAIGAEVTLPSAGLRWATIGADARLAAVEPLPAELFAPPPALLEAFRAGSRGLRLVVVTPAWFRRGWLPNGLQRDDETKTYRGRLRGLEVDLVLRAAFVPRPIEVSGWAVREGVAKRSDRLVPPGAVYFFERADGGVFTDAEARALWLAQLGSRPSGGYGRVVPGVWTPARRS
ncbi:MAG: type III-B CRISPR module-associated Cmr3 family protein [Chloroflexota bacterium]|nr:type III-B CRISPR module-associated protein Cmr3 [Dehalococcoidia bacterium]MDW8253851.1 type III-B CRISPR module-associated Cmr3 family protein [Chloroflexota bacterium]